MLLRKVIYVLWRQNPNFESKKFLPPFHCQLKFFCLLHMIAHSYPYHLSRNKNFSLHTPWDKKFLFPKNTNFESKKFLPPFHCQLKFFCLLHMIAHSYPYHLSRNKNFSKHTSCVKKFLLSKNTNFSTKKFLTPFHTQLKFFCLLHMMAHISS